MDFAQIESKYKELKREYDSGAITEDEFKAQLEELMIEDEEGKWWIIGYETGQWYYHDGEKWVRAEPAKRVEVLPLRWRWLRAATAVLLIVGFLGPWMRGCSLPGYAIPLLSSDEPVYLTLWTGLLLALGLIATAIFGTKGFARWLRWAERITAVAAGLTIVYWVVAVRNAFRDLLWGAWLAILGGLSSIALLLWEAVEQRKWTTKSVKEVWLEVRVALIAILVSCGIVAYIAYKNPETPRPPTPQVVEVEKEVIVEKPVDQTVVVEKEKIVEKPVVETVVVVEKEVLLPTPTPGPLTSTLAPGTFLLKWGSEGSGDGQFEDPQGVAVDSKGNVYVADTHNHRIQVFDSNGNFITKWGSQGSGDGQFTGPYGVAVSAQGNVYVADSGNARIQVFDSNGNFIAKWGSYGSGDGQFAGPSGVDVSAQGNVYVADTDNGRIQVFDSNGNFIAQRGSGGSGDGQFESPYGVAVDTKGNVYVADSEHQRIQVFDSNGDFIAKWGSYGSSDGQFYKPLAVAVDARSNVYVADFYNDRIQVFDSDGNFIAKWGSYGSGDWQFDGPFGVDVDAQGNVYVADSGNHRIQKFQVGQ